MVPTVSFTTATTSRSNSLRWDTWYDIPQNIMIPRCTERWCSSYPHTSLLLMASLNSPTTSSPSQSVALKPLVHVINMPCAQTHTHTHVWLFTWQFPVLLRRHFTKRFYKCLYSGYVVWLFFPDAVPSSVDKIMQQPQLSFATQPA